MFGSTVLEVGIGLVFVYWLLSLICSTINEQVIVPLFKLRARFLEEGLKNILADPQGNLLVNKLYDNHLIKGLSRQTPSGEAQKPSYIPADTFALALIDVVQAAKDNPDVAKSPLPQTLNTLIERANKDSIQELANIEKWYNDSMDRVTGWYKRRVQLIIFFMGLVIVLALNVDTISLITTLSNNTSIRAAFVSAAQGAANAQNNANVVGTIQSNIEKLQPIGWSTITFPTDFWGQVSWVVLKIIGLLATVLAVSLGAPFWFDLLNKFMAFRSSGPVPQPRTGPSESTGAPQQLAVTVTGAPPAVNPPPGGNV